MSERKRLIELVAQRVLMPMTFIDCQMQNKLPITYLNTA